MNKIKLLTQEQKIENWHKKMSFLKKYGIILSLIFFASIFFVALNHPNENKLILYLIILFAFSCNIALLPYILKIIGGDDWISNNDNRNKK